MKLKLNYHPGWTIKHPNGDLYLLYYDFDNSKENSTLEAINRNLKDSVGGLAQEICYGITPLEYNTICLYYTSVTVGIRNVSFTRDSKSNPKLNIKTSKLIDINPNRLAEGFLNYLENLYNHFIPTRKQEFLHFDKYINQYFTVYSLNVLKEILPLIKYNIGNYNYKIKKIQSKGTLTHSRLIYPLTHENYKVGEIHNDFSFMDSYYEKSEDFLERSIRKRLKGRSERGNRLKLLNKVHNFFIKKQEESSELSNLWRQVV